MNEELILVSVQNKDRRVRDCNPYDLHHTEFEMGFLEACDFFQYITCHFSIATAHKIWPPQSEYDRNRALDGTTIVWNHYWDKFEVSGRSSHGFYESLDVRNRMRLYIWYKMNVNR